MFGILCYQKYHLLLLPSNLLEQRFFSSEKRPLVPPRLAGYELCVAAESNDTPAAVSDERLEFVNSTNRKNHLIQGWGEVETNIEMEEVETKMMVVVGEWTRKEGRLSKEEGLLFQT